MRPLPHRGDLVAAGAVPLVVAVAMINIRMDPVWGTGVLLFLDVIAGAGLLALGLLADPEPAVTDRGGTGPGRPRPYIGVLLLGGLLLSFLALLRLSQVLGADAPLGAPGQAFWTLALLAAGALALWWARALAVLVLVAAVAVAGAVFAFVAWVFDPEGAQAFRWVAFLLILGFIGAHLVVREGRRREGVLLVDAAGLVAFLLAYTLAIDLVAPLTSPLARAAGFSPHVPAGWALVCLASGFGLVAFSALEREPGPGFLGVAVLLVAGSITAVAGIDEPSLVGWPLVLLVLGVAGLAVGLRPARPLPPPPPDATGGPGERVDLPRRPGVPPPDATSPGP